MGLTKPIEQIKLTVNKQMDFVTPELRANDFIVANNKIYFLCSDNYTILVYDLMAKDFVKSVELNNVGYYNAIKVSNDRQTVMLTNISSKELTLLDVETDEIVKKLPLNVDVHNIVIIGR